MKTQHTPAPWNVVETPSLWIQGEPDANGFRTVCTFPEHFADNRDRQEANARLIAAAPELLALLVDVGQWLEVGLQQGQINRKTVNRDGDLVSQIRAVVAKAMGGVL